MSKSQQETRIATYNGWQLHHEPRLTAGWHDLSLIAPPELRGSRGIQDYLLFWNGSELVGHDVQTLRKRHPEIMQWVFELCRAVPALDSRERIATLADLLARAGKIEKIIGDAGKDP